MKLSWFRHLLVMSLLLLLLLPLFAETTEDTEQINPKFLSMSKDILQSLLDEDALALELIQWDYFYLNNEDIGSDIIDCSDVDEEDIIKSDVLVYIHGLLHYEGDEQDDFTEWYENMISGEYHTMCSNSRKSVEMLFELDDVDHLVLKELFITDIN